MSRLVRRGVANRGSPSFESGVSTVQSVAGAPVSVKKRPGKDAGEILRISVVHVNILCYAEKVAAAVSFCISGNANDLPPWLCRSRDGGSGDNFQVKLAVVFLDNVSDAIAQLRCRADAGVHIILTLKGSNGEVSTSAV